MKKTLCTIIFMLMAVLPVYSYNLPSLSIDKNQRQVRDTINKYNRAIDKHDINLIKTFYSEDYESADGFGLDELVEMLNKTYSAYKNIKYKTKINNISIFDDFALVYMSDTSEASVYPTERKEIKKEKMGKLDGKSVYVIYLKKQKDDWKIFSDDVLMEETSLRYGIARKINMDLTAPMFIEGGQEYDISLKMDKPDDIIALASISKEEIVYPPADYQEKFRKIPQTGDLERIVKANEKNLDEYAVASVGFTRVSINEEVTKAKIEVLGMAYLMKRINLKRYPNAKDAVKEGV